MSQTKIHLLILPVRSDVIREFDRQEQCEKRMKRNLLPDIIIEVHHCHHLGHLQYTSPIQDRQILIENETDVEADRPKNLNLKKQNLNDAADQIRAQVQVHRVKAKTKNRKNDPEDPAKMTDPQSGTTTPEKPTNIRIDLHIKITMTNMDSIDTDNQGKIKTKLKSE